MFSYKNIGNKTNITMNYPIQLFFSKNAKKSYCIEIFKLKNSKLCAGILLGVNASFRINMWNHEDIARNENVLAQLHKANFDCLKTIEILTKSNKK